jgi:SH3-like domain-containing protein
MHRNHWGRVSLLSGLLAAALLLGGCGLLAGAEEPAPTPTPESPRAVVPTFTATPVVEQAPPAEPTATATPQVITVDAAVAAASDAPAADDAATAVAATAVAATAVAATAGAATAGAASASAETATPAPQPRLTVQQNLVNVRLGPGTTFGLAGTANQGDAYDVKGKSADGQWWLVCCINGKEAWVFGELATVENGDLSQVVEAPAAPVVAQQPAAQPAAPAAPAAPTATPEPAPAAPPAAADPCAGIGGDGCKFRLRAGPSFAANGGGELKLQLHFIHSGIDGGQPQGSYFVWVEKDGQKLPISDGTRSIALNDQQGMLGKYNYEFKVGRDQIPGNNVAGGYAIWVLDGNGERDSQTFTFSVPEGQGEVWMQFDQG